MDLSLENLFLKICVPLLIRNFATIFSNIKEVFPNGRKQYGKAGMASVTMPKHLA
jgi:hypothetical protein